VKKIHGLPWLKYLESTLYNLSAGVNLAKILKANNLVAKYSIKRTYATLLSLTPLE